VINKASNVTTVRYRLAIINGDVSDILGPSGQDFCDQLGIYAAYPDHSPLQEGAGTDDSFTAYVHDVEQYCDM